MALHQQEAPELAPPRPALPSPSPPGLRLGPHTPRPASAPRTSVASTSAVEEFWARSFRCYHVELFSLDAFGMAVFAGPAKPLLSLNPQEEAKFHKEVAQVRRRATKVSGVRGRTAGGGGWRGLGSLPGRVKCCAVPSPRAPLPPHASATSRASQGGPQPRRA